MAKSARRKKAKDYANSFDAKCAAARAVSRGKRELKELLEWDFFDLD